MGCGEGHVSRLTLRVAGCHGEHSMTLEYSPYFMSMPSPAIERRSLPEIAKMRFLNFSKATNPDPRFHVRPKVTPTRTYSAIRERRQGGHVGFTRLRHSRECAGILFSLSPARWGISRSVLFFGGHEDIQIPSTPTNLGHCQKESPALLQGRSSAEQCNFHIRPG